MTQRKALENQIKKQVQSWPKTTKAVQDSVTQYMAKNAPTQFKFRGLRIPLVRQSFKKLPIKNLNRQQQLEIFLNLWNQTDKFEVALFSLYWLEELDVEELVIHCDSILKFSDRIDNWAHSDAYSNILAKIYEAAPGKLDSQFEVWRQSPNPWFRRLSIVGLLYYSRMRKKYPTYKKLISSVEPLLGDSHYYVQKGVGWTLREIYNVYPEHAFKFFLKKAEVFHPAAWYAVTEKLTANEKKQIKLKRFSKKGKPRNVRKNSNS